ncbi:MAG: hypothetical protein IQL11_09280, partial [Bacteroidales bacterium]|nr:hypothetical protein [Bacteroidales bacterium]
LNLRNPAGKVVSHNIYWISPDGNYKQLRDLNETFVSTGVLKSEKLKNENRWTIKITNSSGRIAFFIRPQLLAGGEEVLPASWSAGYFSLGPGESTTISVSCPAAALAGENTVLMVSGWNVPEQRTDLGKTGR